VATSNSSVIYGTVHTEILPANRRKEKNPDLEIGRFLSEKVGFAHIARLAAGSEYQLEKPAADSAILQEFVLIRATLGAMLYELSPAFYEKVGSTTQPKISTSQEPANLRTNR